MIKIFLPVNKGKIKSGIRGFWQNESGKVYYDYLTFIKHFDINFESLEDYKIIYKQEAIAFIDDDVLKIYYDKNKIEVLKHKIIYYKIGFYGLKKLIKYLLREYSGLTIYKESQDGYRLEVFYN